MRYKKKPVIIDAVIFKDEDYFFQEIGELGLDPIRISYEDPSNPIIIIETLEGEIVGNVGDYIIKGVKGEFYPCKPDIFEMSYEKVGD